MSLLPAYIEDEDFLTEEIEIPHEFGIDFATGQLSGEIVEGAEAIKVWIYLILRIARYRYTIVSWQYGNELEELYGKGYTQEHIECEATEMIKDCILANEYIDSVEVSNITLIDGKLSAHIKVTTVFDETIEQEYKEVA